jgi:hypothetical protein
LPRGNGQICNYHKTNMATKRRPLNKEPQEVEITATIPSTNETEGREGREGERRQG